MRGGWKRIGLPLRRNVGADALERRGRDLLAAVGISRKQPSPGLRACGRAERRTGLQAIEKAFSFRPDAGENAQDPAKKGDVNSMKLSTALTPIRQIDPRMVSYNIEMTEVTGGTFWKAYTSGQIDGTEEFRFSGELTDFTSTKDLVQYYPPINLYDEKLRAYARKLGRHGFAFPGPGRPRPIMTLKA